MENHEFYMKRCIELARQGEGHVSPNPLVGAVIVDGNGNIVGEGYHQQFGEAHAEVNAISQAGEKAKGATLYVNLEPCSHWGKTPPCADLVIKTGIKTLVVGMKDPNPLVAGRGLKKCEAAGIKVITNILEEDCKRLNEIFIKNMNSKKAFVAIKTATTTDGKIATANNSSKWITSGASIDYVHRLRNAYDAILTSSNTILCDDPSLTCRIEGGRNPVRVVVDTNLKTSPDAKVYNNDGIVVYLAANQDLIEANYGKYPENVELIGCPLKDGHVDLAFLMSKLYEKGVYSVLVEAGGILNGAFLKAELVDKIYQFIAPKILGDKNAKNWVEGFALDDINNCIRLVNVDVVKMVGISGDILIIHRILRFS